MVLYPWRGWPMTVNFLADDVRNRSVTLWYVLTGKFTFHKRTEKHIENNQSCVACTSKLTTTWVDEPKSEDNGNRGHTGPWWTINARRNICTIRPVGMSKKFRHGSSSSKTWQTKYERERPRGVTLNLTTFREQAEVLHIPWNVRSNTGSIFFNYKRKPPRSLYEW